MNNDLFQMFEDYKIVVYIPQNDSDQIIEKLLKLDLNNVGNYTNCVSWTGVKSTWMPIGEANPYIGEKNRRSFEDEVRLEFVCKRANVKRIISHIKKIHPYEKAEIDIIPIFTQDSFVF